MMRTIVRDIVLCNHVLRKKTDLFVREGFGVRVGLSLGKYNKRLSENKGFCVLMFYNYVHHLCREFRLSQTYFKSSG